jgi:hypothetical protein
VKKPADGFKFTKALIILVFASTFNAVPKYVLAQDAISLEDERTRQLQEMGALLPKPELIRSMAKELFLQPLDEQDIEKLREIASNANVYSNLVSKITDGYNDYLRENTRYDFVGNAVRKASIVPELLELDSEFKDIRNQAYLNLGLIYQAKGQEMEAFLLFNDAYRLSAFDCPNGSENCIRYSAEQHMKTLLGIKGVSYVYWQK